LLTYPAIGMASVTESPADVARLIFGAANRDMESSARPRRHPVDGFLRRPLTDVTVE
jgi:hypothetical protein